MVLPKVSKESVFEALNIIDRDGVPNQNQSIKYNLVTEDGKKYPPKYVVAVAKHIENGKPISTEGFNAIDAAHYLRKLGFTITEQNEQDNPMNETNPFDWVDFYKEFAQKLLEYKNDRTTLIEKVRAIYENTGLALPTLEKDNNIIDIDPFTVFALFNKGITDNNRKKITAAIKDLFSVKAPLPTSFGGIPVVNNLKATYYRFISERRDSDIGDLWGLFESALAYVDNHSAENQNRLIEYITRAKEMGGNGYAKITMGLFWIAPDTFVNLDSSNKKYLYESGEVPSEVLQGLPKMRNSCKPSVYFDILERLRNYIDSDATPLRSFPELSRTAYFYDYKKDQPNITGPEQEPRYWTYAPGEKAKHWDEFYKAKIIAIGWNNIGDLNEFDSKNDIKEELTKTLGPGSHKNSAKTLWQFSHAMNTGAIVFATKGKYLIVGRGIVESDYEYDKSRSSYKHIRKIKWTHRGEWQNPRGYSIRTLDEITERTGYIDILNELLEVDPDDDGNNKKSPPYTKDDFLSEVYMDEDNYDKLTSLILRKKNIILQGAPGVGKTFAARRLAARCGTAWSPGKSCRARRPIPL